VRDDREPRAHRFDQRDAEALVVREREERGRAAVEGDELLDVHAAGEGHVVAEAGLVDLRVELVEVRRGHRRRPDEVEARGAIAPAVCREGGDDVVDGLLREDLADDEDRRALVGELARDRRVRCDVELLPVVEDRDNCSGRTSGSLKLHSVEFGICESELSDLRELLQLLAAEIAVLPRMLVQPGEVMTRRDVVVHDRLALRELRDLTDDVVSHRVVDEQERVLRQLLEIAPVAHKRADLGLRLPGEEIAAHIGRPEQAL